MSTETTVLDEGLYGNPTEPITSNLASTGQRLGNYLIDIVAIYILVFVIMLGFFSTHETAEESPFVTLLTYLIFPLYYIVAEGSSGKTLGKMITRTKVVNIEGEKPSMSTVLLRTVCRIVPFEAFSAFSSSKKMWHDSWSKTYVIKSK